MATKQALVKLNYRSSPSLGLCAMALLVCAVGALTWVSGGEELLGTLDEGKVYRVVEGHPIKGKAIADVLVEQSWEKERAAFAEHLLIRAAMKKKGITVPDEEVIGKLKKLALRYAQKNNVDPRMFKLKHLARTMGGYSLEFLKEQTRDSLGIKKLLLKSGALKKEQKLKPAYIGQIMQAFIQDLVKKHDVRLDKLEEGEAVRVDGRGYSKEKVRAFIVDGLGPVTKENLENVLELLTLEHLLNVALEKHGRSKVDREDKDFHFSYRARVKEHIDGVPNGRQAILFELQQTKISVAQYFANRPFTLDAGITFLARKQVRKKDVKAEWELNAKDYQQKERLIAHILIKVRDQQGRAYSPGWKAKGHEKVNRYVEKIREEQFALAKPKIVRLMGLADGNFVQAAVKFSDDEGTKGQGGMIGRVGLKSSLPTIPIDGDLILEALKLEPGELSQPIRSAYGWHLVKCLEKAKQKTRFDEVAVQEHIYVSLLKRRRKVISDKWLNEAKIENMYSSKP